jgi:hypothetical protein
MSPMRQSHLVVPFYLVASLVLTWPLARHFDSQLPSVFTSYDALLQVFLLGWGWHGLSTNFLEVFNAPIFYPELRTLTYMDHMLGESVLAGPVIETFGPGAGYNALVILSFVLSGYFTYRLARLFGISRSGSCLAGFLFAFCPYRFTHLGALNQLQTQFIPLGLFFAVQFLRSGRLKYGIGASFTLALQSYFGWYSTFHLLVALALLIGWEVLREGGGWRRVPWRKGVPLALTTAALALPVTLPYLLQRLAMPEFNRPFSETIRCSADLLDYLRVNSENILAWAVPSLGHMFGFFPGVVAAGLAVVAFVSLYRDTGNIPLSEPRRNRAGLLGRVLNLRSFGDMGYLLVLGFSGFVLSLGPILQVAGHRLWIPLPYALCYYVIPGFSSMRTPGRFAVLVALAAAVLAGKGFDVLRRRYPQLGSTLLAGTLLVAGVLAWSPNIPFVSYPDRASMPPVYSWLAEQPDSSPVLEVPVPARDGMERPTDARRQMYVLYHGKPRLDGASGFSSNRYNAFRRDIQAFPAEDAIRRAFEMGARRLIVHYGNYAPGRRVGLRRRVENARNLHEVAVFGQDVVYEIVDPWPPIW